MPKPPQLTPFDEGEKWLYFELPLDIRAPYPIFKAEPSHPPKETNINRLYLWSHFGHDPTLKTISEGLNEDGPLN